MHEKRKSNFLFYFTSPFSCRHTVYCAHSRKKDQRVNQIRTVILSISAYLQVGTDAQVTVVPQLIVTEDGQCRQLARESFLVVERLVLAHFVEDSSCIGRDTFVSCKNNIGKVSDAAAQWQDIHRAHLNSKALSEEQLRLLARSFQRLPCR